MLASRSATAKAVTCGASKQQAPAVLGSKNVSWAQAPCRGVRHHAQALVAPRLTNAQAIAQRVRSAAVADGGAAATTSTTTTETTTEGLLELNKDTFQQFIDQAGDKLVVVDFFTDWCGPCKLIYPELVKLSGELAPAATIVKFNCNQANKELAKALGIKVAPTFQLYKNGQKVADMTGAKVDKLRAIINEHLPAGEQNN